MTTFVQKQLFMIILIAAASIGILVGVWGLAFYDENAINTTLDTSTADASTTEPPIVSTQTTQPTETTVPPISSAETTTAKPHPTIPQGKIIALTFDDGPSLNYTPEILDLLEKYHAKATFFVNGYQLTAGKSNSLRRAVAMGCEIGNHTENHSNLTKLSQDEIYREIQSTNEKITELCGYEVTLLRPPGGNTNLSVMQEMYDSGLRMNTILWNNDSLDWSFNADYVNGDISREKAIQETYETILGYPLDGAIVLMHDIKGITPDVLELLLQKLTSEGYTFVTVSELFDFESMGKDAYFSKFYAEGYYITLSE